jgi:hypothetical protein
MSPYYFGGFVPSGIVLRSLWAITELKLPMALSCLAFGLSDTNLTLLDISTCVQLWSASWGNQSLYSCFGLQRLCLIKNLMGFPCEEKSTCLIDKKVKVKRWPVYILQSLTITRLSVCKNYEGRRRSKSAPAPFLHCLPNGTILVLFFLPPQMV